MNPTPLPAPRRVGSALLAAALLGTAVLGGCVPLVVGGAVGTAMVASDRRTSGAQLEDEGIELRSVNRIRDSMGETSHINVTSYNRLVLLTGEVASAQAKQQLSDLIAKVDNVRSVVNETAIDVPSSLGQRSADTLTTGKVKAALVDTRNIQSRAYKVVTERGVVYLMGIVTQREADLAAEVARNVGGVQKVVKVFQVVTEAELARAQSDLRPPPEAPASTAAPAATPVVQPQPTTQPPLSQPAPVTQPTPVPVQTMPVR